MAFDLHGIYLCDEGDGSTPNWLACTRKGPLTKKMSREEIETIDIGKTCDTLRSAVMLKYNSSQEHEDPHTAAATIPENSLPGLYKDLTFRNCAYLCCYTVRIYQQQVNYLLDKSKNLMRASKFQLVSALGSNKRKRGIGEPTDCRRKRLKSTIRDTVSPINTYEEFLQEVSDLQKWAETQEFALETSTPNKTGRRRVSQISKLVITEVITDVAVDDLDEDSGFGEASLEEIAEFRDLFTSNRLEIPIAEGSAKRRTSVDMQPHKKRCQMGEEDHGFESLINQTAEAETILCCPDISSMIGPETNTEMRAANTTHQSHRPAISTSTPTTHTKNSRKKNSSKLVIDEITKIPHCEMRNQIQNLIICTRPMTYGALVKSSKLQEVDLLYPNKGSQSILTKLTEGQKPIVDPLKDQNNYLDLLHDIFGRYPSEELATTVHRKWNHPTKPRAAQKRRRAQNPRRMRKTSATTNINEQIFDSGEHDILQGYNVEDIKSEWSTCGVLMKLISKWQTAATNCMDTEINAEHILRTTNSRANAAMAFSSLLLLAANRYIVITKAENSIEMHSIKVGEAAENLIQTE